MTKTITTKSDSQPQASRAEASQETGELAIKSMVRWPIDKLVPYEKNAKEHPEEQVKRLASTIKRFGWDQPIVIDRNGVIIKGHGRRLAAIELGLKEVPVLIRDDLSADEADAVRIADNAVVSNRFDTRTLHDELTRLMATDDLTFDLDDLGLATKDRELMLTDKEVEINLDAFISDTQDEVEKQKREEAERLEASDREEIPLGEAFGFKRLTRSEARRLNEFLAHMEHLTGKEGREAFTDFIDNRLWEHVA